MKRCLRESCPTCSVSSRKDLQSFIFGTYAGSFILLFVGGVLLIFLLTPLLLWAQYVESTSNWKLRPGNDNADANLLA